MTMPPRGPGYRRYWAYYDRPRSGCGCLYTILMIFILYWLFSLFITPLAFGF